MAKKKLAFGGYAINFTSHDAYSTGVGLRALPKDCKNFPSPDGYGYAEIAS